MEVVETVARMRELRKRMQGSVGFVPTMGFLHEGHISLVREARERDGHAVVSIFVNPAQFGPNEDFARYPRDPERDLAMLKDAGTDVVFMPTVHEIYPEGFSTYVEVGGLTEVLEGAHRPGHFRGVTTVVAKLFEIVQADRAYFGMKDYQQLAVIRKMARDLSMATEVVGMATVREPDGLAMSSRNTYLSGEERKAALVLSRSLQMAEDLWREGERDAEVIRRRMLTLLGQEPLARVDYVSVADADTLQELQTIERAAVVSMAVHLGATRLIDNVVIGSE